MYEVEKKYRVKDFESLLKRIRDSGLYSEKEQVYQHDTVFLPKDTKSFKDLTPGDPVIRIRSENNKVRLTLKRQRQGASNLELEVDLGNFEVGARILNELDLNKVVEIKKRRIEFQNRNITIAFDEVEKLGSFVEVEVITSKGEKEAEEKVVQLASEMGLSNHDVEEKKYDKLLSQS